MTDDADERLMAYVDGEMDGPARAAFERAMAADPDLARRVAKQQALRARLRQAFDGTLAEPVPPRLLAAVRTTAIAPRSRRLPAASWFAMAASLVLGVLLGQRVLLPTTSQGVVAQGELSRALSQRLAAEQRTGDTMRVGVTFQSRSGEYCRTFVVQTDVGMAGLACRKADAWLIRTLETDIAAREPDGALRQAGTVLPESVRKAVEARIVGEPLDAEGETRARARGWRAP